MKLGGVERCDGSGLIREDVGKPHEYARRCRGCCDHPEADRVQTEERWWPASWGGGRRRHGGRVNCGRCGAVVALPCKLVGMRHEGHKIRLPSPIGNGNGDAKDCRNLIDKMVQIKGGTRVYDIALEFSIDNTVTWEVLVAAASADVTATDFPQSATHIRAVVSSFTSETAPPVITLTGRNAETGP